MQEPTTVIGAVAVVVAAAIVVEVMASFVQLTAQSVAEPLAAVSGMSSTPSL